MTLLVLLLGVAVTVGLYAVPAGGPDPGALPQVTPPTATSAAAEPRPTPSLPVVPTPPARPADLLAPFAGRVSAAVGVPVVAIQAYAYAQLSLQNSAPNCHLSWTTLAGIGEVESHHGQADNAVLQRSGRSSPVVAGPALDGVNGRALVQDTDAGAFDGDMVYDRAMGPLHLLPSVWRAHQVDADGDGIADPYDIDDAALALGEFLCSNSADLSKLSGWNAAVGRYHPGEAYSRTIFTTADSYGQRTRDIA